MKVKIQSIPEGGVQEKISKTTNRKYNLTTFIGADGVLYTEVYGKYEVGDEIEGEWENGQYGRKFKVAPRGNAFGARGGGGVFRGKSPEEIESIERQSTLSVAEKVVGSFYQGNTGIKKPATLEAYAKEVARTGQFFYRGLRAEGESPKAESPKAQSTTTEEFAQAALDMGGEVVTESSQEENVDLGGL